MACNNHKTGVLSPAQQKAQFDSVIKEKIKEAMENEAQLLRDRMTFEMKEKVDSIERELNHKKGTLPAISNIDSLSSSESKQTDSSTLISK